MFSWMTGIPWLDCLMLGLLLIALPFFEDVRKTRPPGLKRVEFMVLLLIAGAGFTFLGIALLIYSQGKSGQ